jgi:hypothetical protein
MKQSENFQPENKEICYQTAIFLLKQLLNKDVLYVTMREFLHENQYFTEISLIMDRWPEEFKQNKEIFDLITHTFNKFKLGNLESISVNSVSVIRFLVWYVGQEVTTSN